MKEMNLINLQHVKPERKHKHTHTQTTIACIFQLFECVCSRAAYYGNGSWWSSWRWWRWWCRMMTMIISASLSRQIICIHFEYVSNEINIRNSVRITNRQKSNGIHKNAHYNGASEPCIIHANGNIKVAAPPNGLFDIREKSNDSISHCGILILAHPRLGLCDAIANWQSLLEILCPQNQEEKKKCKHIKDV